MKHNISLLFLLSVLTLWSNFLQAGVTVSIDRNPVRVNESFQLFFETDTSVDSNPDFSPLRRYFESLSTSQSNNISISNGKYQRSMKWTLQVMPQQEGDFVLPAIKFGNDQSELFRVTVKSANESSSAASDGLIFELISDDTSVYVQSQVLVTLRLMSDSNISGYQMGDLQIEDMDVVVEPLGDVKQYQTKLNDKPYLVLERQFALFPQQSGILNIGPILAEVRYGSRSRSLFDPFQSSGELRRVASKKITLRVQTRPETFNAAFWLPSKSVKLNEDWRGNLDQIRAGEPLTRIISLTAEGLTSAQLPELDQVDVAGIKQYPDKPVLEDQRSAQGINGIRQQRTAIIATAAGQYTLPEITIPWWNLKTGTQEIARLPARTIEVRPAATEATASQSAEAVKPLLTDGSVESVDRQPESVSYWMWVSIVLALGWIVSIFFWWIKRKGSSRLRSESENLSDNNLRKASKHLRRACMNSNASDARIALLSWANAVVDNKKFNNLNQVTRYFGSPLKQQVDLLNRGLYSSSEGDWKGDSLWECCEQVSAALTASEDTSKQQNLSPLIP